MAWRATREEEQPMHGPDAHHVIMFMYTHTAIGESHVVELASFLRAQEHALIGAITDSHAHIQDEKVCGHFDGIM